MSFFRFAVGSLELVYNQFKGKITIIHIEHDKRTMHIMAPYKPLPGLKGLSLDDIPGCPVADQQILALITDDDVHLTQMGMIIEESANLSVMILGLANSAFFSPPRPVNSIPDAIINVIGLGMTRSLVLSVILGRSLTASSCPNFSMEDFWTDSLMTGRLCQMLMTEGDFRGPPPTEAMYMCGLLVQFGQFLLVDHYPDEMNELLSVADANIDQLLLNQAGLLGVDQSQAGGLMGRRWQLPDVVIATMQYAFDDDYRGENWQMVRLAGVAARQVLALRHGLPLVGWPASLDQLVNKPMSMDLLAQLPSFRHQISLIASILASKPR
ncbi:MAG: HD-like signal output (HDOD) protein [Candidatus Azotimanducaceae bacterium]